MNCLEHSICISLPWGQFVASKTNNIKGKRKRTEKALHHKQRQIKIQNNKAPFVHRSPFNFIKRDYNCALNVFFRPSLHQHYALPHCIGQLYLYTVMWEPSIDSIAQNFVFFLQPLAMKYKTTGLQAIAIKFISKNYYRGIYFDYQSSHASHCKALMHYILKLSSIIL